MAEIFNTLVNIVKERIQQKLTESRERRVVSLIDQFAKRKERVLTPTYGTKSLEANYRTLKEVRMLTSSALGLALLQQIQDIPGFSHIDAVEVSPNIFLMPNGLEAHSDMVKDDLKVLSVLRLHSLSSSQKRK